MAKLTIVGIHGLGDHRNDPWAGNWEATIRASLPSNVQFEFVPFTYDDIFEKVDVSLMESATAFAKLAGSGLASGIGGLFGRRAVARGMFDGLTGWLRWYAGYVVAWLEDDQFRAEVRKRLLQTIGDKQPDVILAHSLGSLISYDTFTSNDDLKAHPSAKSHLPNVTYVTLGSQIGNPFVVRNLTPGRIEMPPVKRWLHLYNSEDAAFTAEIELPGEPKFAQVDTYFDIAGMGDHDAVEYLSHRATKPTLWEPLAMESSGVRSLSKTGTARFAAQTSLSAVRALAKPKDKEVRQRALLVGINEYPNPEDRLSGCLNDVFLMSSVLQECRFTPDQIRVVLDDRATAKGILERMAWLVDGAAPGDTLVFYYSGHGAQLPTYGMGDKVDRMDETLVPHDFNWSPETCITDDQIFRLYSQLPYDVRLVMIFDCCHSGGIHRDGGVKVRGLTPPDDIRHRALRWDPEVSMWVPRDLSKLNADFSDDENVQRQFCGKSGSLARLGRAMPLRGLSRKDYDAKKTSAKGKPIGPYLPVVIEACQESEYSYEYRHGVQSFGAFTYSLADILRRTRTITFENLVKQAGSRLRDLGYDQKPAILGPRKILKANVPWTGKSAE